MKGSITRYCACRDPETGKQFGGRCPQLKNTKHGQWEIRDRLPGPDGEERPFRRRGFSTKGKAGEFRDAVYALLSLSKGDDHVRVRIADMVIEKTRNGGQLPDLEDVRRRIGIGHALDRSKLMREALEEWYAAKKRAKRDSTLRSYRGHLDHYLLPKLGHFAIDRCSALHISDLFDWIDEMNVEILSAAEEGRRPVLEDDVRQRAKVVGPATQRRIYATLRNFFNWAMRHKPTPLVDFNPTLLVELPPEYREPARTWAPEQVGTFLDFTEGDPLYYLFRLVLLHGPRRGEAVGARWAGFDHGTRVLRVLRPLLQLGGRLVESTPKTRAGERVLFLDEDTAEGIRRLHVQQAKARLEWGDAYVNDDLIWAHEDGTPLSPDWVTRRFKELAEAAGLPPIKLHEGRHTAATLRLEAGTDIKIVSEQMGHATSAITRDLYQHVRRAVLDQSTDAVIRLLPERKKKRDEETG